MNSISLSLFRPSSWLGVCLSLLVIAATPARAVNKGALVSYDPVSEDVYGDLPYVSSYVLNVTAPTALTSFPVTVTLRKVSTFAPLGDAATAETYVQFSADTLTFTNAGQTLPVTVNLNFPASALSTAVPAGAYAYRIYTDGWPAGFTDAGAAISASVTLPLPAVGNAPTVTITSPTDGTPLSFAVGALPASVPFTFNATVDSASPGITLVDAGFGTSTSLLPVAVVSTGLGGNSVSGTGAFVVTAPGTYMLQVRATNLVGSATDTNTYPVTVTAPAPTVAITNPAPGSNYTYRIGDPATVVDFTFAAHSSYGGIRTLVAKVDNAAVAFTPMGLNTLTATGTLHLSYTSAGAHTVSVVATDDYGTAADNSDFTVAVVSPNPGVSISAPTPLQVFTLPTNATTMNVNYAFTSTAQNAFKVDSVTASLGATSLTPTTTGLGTASATSTGTLTLAAGTYTITATATSSGITATSSVPFVVKATAPQPPPPTVSINSPAPNSVFTRISGGPAASVPLTFTGTSTAQGGVVTNLQATLDGSPIAVTKTGIGQTTATGSATLSVTGAGVHTISVVATDTFGSATATRTFEVKIVTAKSICGRVFFDANFNGKFDGGNCVPGDYGHNDDDRCNRDGDHDHCGRDDDHDQCGRDSDRNRCDRDSHDSDQRHNDCDRSRDDDRHDCGGSGESGGVGDFGLAGVTIRLLDATNALVASKTTNASGEYCFDGLVPGSYTIVATAAAGLDATTPTQRVVTVGTSNVTVSDIGFGIDFNALRSMKADGNSHGFWKTNIDKAIAGKTNGTQVSKRDLLDYTDAIGSLGLAPYDGISLKEASSILGSNSSRPADLLSKQLLAAEYNYENGAYLNGNQSLTFVFIWWGENVLDHASNYPSSYVLWAKDWFDAYNNSHGGVVDGPAP